MTATRMVDSRPERTSLMIAPDPRSAGMIGTFTAHISYPIRLRTQIPDWLWLFGGPAHGRRHHLTPTFTGLRLCVPVPPPPSTSVRDIDIDIVEYELEQFRYGDDRELTWWAWVCLDDRHDQHRDAIRDQLNVLMALADRGYAHRIPPDDLGAAANVPLDVTVAEAVYDTMRSYDGWIRLRGTPLDDLVPQLPGGVEHRSPTRWIFEELFLERMVSMRNTFAAEMIDGDRTVTWDDRRAQREGATHPNGHPDWRTWLDTTPQESHEETGYLAGSYDDCWRCDATRATTDLGLCDHCHTDLKDTDGADDRSVEAQEGT